MTTKYLNFDFYSNTIKTPDIPKFNPLSASFALIQKLVNWFAQQTWFLYEGNTGT